MTQDDSARPAVSRSSAAFGRFPSVGAFLDAYRDAVQLETRAVLAGLTLERRAGYLATPRRLVEAHATVLHREPDDTDAAGGLHDRFTAALAALDAADPEVRADAEDCLHTGRSVFVAVRVGDALGIRTPIAGLTDGAAVHLKGEWITRERAQAHGGERLSVLHFTHHPLGFICTPADCYS